MAHKTIKYIAYYDTQDSDVKRNFVTSASNKLEYIAKCIGDGGKSVEIISMSEVVEPSFRYYRKECKQIAENVVAKLPASWGGNSLILRKAKILWHLFQLFFTLIIECGKDDTVVVYHSLGYYDVVWLAKLIRRFRLILEVEEIYSDVSNMPKQLRNREFRMFGIADAYILSTESLNTFVNPNHKPSVVIYGTYQAEPIIAEKFADNKIHVIYAGTFDPDKGGAQNAISAAKYLPENYHIHICGFGTSQAIRSVKSLIETVSKESKAEITYDGLKMGKEFVEFLQKCHIGLSTQKPEGIYNDTSFPSKILTYMANGLSVVSIKIPVVALSELSSSISFYEKSDGADIAKAIEGVQNIDGRTLVASLDKRFKIKLQTLMEEFE